MSLMEEMIYTAKDRGADIAKFQLYDIDTIMQPSDEWYWDLKRGQISYEDWLDINEMCEYVGIECMASVFDTERVKWCEETGMKRYKIASRSIYQKDLIEAVLATGKPIIASLGMYHEKEFPAFPADFLFCVSKYPTLPEDINFSEIDFTKYAGFSDHTLGIEASVMAIARGARIIEKHFTMNKELDGADHAGSAEPDELEQIVSFNKRFAEILR